MLLFALAACTPEPSVADEPDAPVAECTPDEDCIDAGVQRFVSHGQEREITVLLPADPQGAPVVFAWHYLNGKEAEYIEWMKL